jgi:hypothetical protein
MSLYVINTLQDLITKYTSEKKYVNGDKVWPPLEYIGYLLFH